MSLVNKIIPRCYYVERLVYNSINSKVYLCKKEQITKSKKDNEEEEKFIMKVLVKDNDMRPINREISMLEQVKGLPNFIKLIDRYEDRENVYLFFEPAKCDLFKYIFKRPPLCEVHVARIMYQIYEALDVMHSNRIWHRDIKPENILIMDEQYFNIVICDFGCAKQFQSGEKCKEICGTDLYYAPEQSAHKECM